VSSVGGRGGRRPPTPVELVLVDPEPSGLAEMLAGLLESNLARDPRRSSLVRPAVIELAAVDAGVTVTVRMRGGRVEIADGRSGGGDVEIRAPSQGLLALSTAPLRWGFPDPFRPAGRAVLREVLGRRVRVSGMLRHPAVLSRFTRLLSVA
jgi:hypothetical protein